MVSLLDYFPFSAGKTLTVAASKFGITGRHGTASVTELTPEKVEIEIVFPKTTSLFGSSPETRARILCEYRGAETGNRMCMEIGEDLIEDDHVKIQAYPSDNRLRIDPSVEGKGHADIALSVKRIGESTVRLTDVSGVPELDGVTITLSA